MDNTLLANVSTLSTCLWSAVNNLVINEEDNVQLYLHAVILKDYWRPFVRLFSRYTASYT